MRIVVVNNHTIHINTIEKLFSHTDTITYISYMQIGGYNFQSVDCILLTGSSVHPYYSDRFSKELHIFHQLSIPIIGICLGCELLVEAFGGVLSKHNERVVGDMTIYAKDGSLPYTVHEAHRYSVISLSSNLQGLAKSDYGYEIIKHKDKPFIGFQFHPEVMNTSIDGYNLFLEYTKSLFHETIQTHHRAGEHS